MALITCPECGHSISDKAKKCPECGYILPRRKPSKKKRCLALVITLSVISLCLIAAGAYGYASVYKPAEAVSLKIERFESQDVPRLQDIQDVQKAYSGLSDLQKKFVKNYSTVEEKYQARKEKDLKSKADLLEQVFQYGGVVGCKASFKNDVFKIVEDYNSDYSLVMFRASEILGPAVASSSGETKRQIAEMGYPEVSVIIEARVSGITVCTAKDGTLTS